jgi:hypothetical protein
VTTYLFDGRSITHTHWQKTVEREDTIVRCLCRQPLELLTDIVELLVDVDELLVDVGELHIHMSR